MEHDKYIVALGLVSTCKPDMVIDIDDPVGMILRYAVSLTNSAPATPNLRPNYLLPIKAC